METKPTVAALPSDGRLWSVQDVSAFLGLPVATLYRWRWNGCGPTAYRIGRHLRYDPVTVRAWLADHLD